MCEISFAGAWSFIQIFFFSLRDTEEYWRITNDSKIHSHSFLTSRWIGKDLHICYLKLQIKKTVREFLKGKTPPVSRTSRTDQRLRDIPAVPKSYYTFFFKWFKNVINILIFYKLYFSEDVLRTSAKLFSWPSSSCPGKISLIPARPHRSLSLWLGG